MNKIELQNEIHTLHKQLGETTLRMLEGMTIMSKQMLTIVIRERQLRMALEALKYLRDAPDMTGWGAHILSERIIKEIYAVTEGTDETKI